MEANMEVNEPFEDEEEHILMDFEDIDGKIDISAGTPYVLTDLDSLNPVLVIGDNIKLIGEYQETVGTCIVFNESDCKEPMVHQETEPSELNLFQEKCIVDDTNTTKQVKPIATLQRILKFRLAEENAASTSKNN